MSDPSPGCRDFVSYRYIHILMGGGFFNIIYSNQVGQGESKRYVLSVFQRHFYCYFCTKGRGVNVFVNVFTMKTDPLAA